MSVNPSPIGGFAGQFFDNNGQPLSGGKVYTYAAGTTTPQATYTSALGVTPHANPIVLDSAGRVPGGEIWLTDGLIYKFVFETSTAILIGTYDNIIGVNSNFVNYTVQEEVITATAGQTVFNLSTINYTPGTNSLSVYIDGVNQYVGDSYLETDSNTVTFTSGVHVGAEVKFTTAVQTTTGAMDASMVGYTAGFTGATGQTVQTKLEQYVSVKDFGAVGDGVTDDTAAIQAANAVGTTVYFPEGTYLLGSNTTLSSDIAFADGAEISVPVSVTLTVNASINANREIFDGAGTVVLDNSPTGYNLSWFKTANGYINERFDFAKRGMTSFNDKVIRIPHPYAGQAGSTIISVSRNVWLFDAPLVFTDKQNTSKVYVEGEFLAAGNCAAFMEFDDALKPESIFFYGAIQAAALPAQVVNVGIDMKAGERVQFFCNVVLNGFQTGVRIGSASMTASANTCYFPQLTVSFFYQNAVLVYGASGTLTAQGNRFGNLNAIAAQVAGLSAVKVVGLVRNLQIDNVIYTTDVPKDGYLAVDAENVVELDSAVAGVLMSHVLIGRIYQATANVGVKVTSSLSSANLISHVDVGSIFSKFGGVAADIDYCQTVNIGNVENTGSVTIRSNASFTKVTSNAGLSSVTNSGSNSIINGIGQQTRGAGVPPSPAVIWPVGTVIRETTDNRLYLRIANAGAATDFIMIRGALRGTTAARPTLAATDVGQLYLDNTLDADGKPIWWNGTAWVDATGAVV